MSGKKEPAKVRLFKGITKTNTCWLWNGYKHRSGYGNIKVDGKVIKTHRLSWTIHNGEIPKGMCVLHKCDVRSCVNPKHLFLGTQRDNLDDMVKKGRSNHGEKHPLALLTKKDVLRIRMLFKKEKSISELAEKFNVGYHVIWFIVRNKSWKQI